MELTWINENLPLIVALVVWEFAWKGVALWKAARNDDKPWFVAMIVVNSAGILPLAYIYLFSKHKKTSK